MDTDVSSQVPWYFVKYKAAHALAAISSIALNILVNRNGTIRTRWGYAIPPNLPQVLHAWTEIKFLRFIAGEQKPTTHSPIPPPTLMV